MPSSWKYDMRNSFFCYVSYIQSIGLKQKHLERKASYIIYIFLCLSGIHICNKCMKTYSILGVWDLKNIRGLQIHSTIILS